MGFAIESLSPPKVTFVSGSGDALANIDKATSVAVVHDSSLAWLDELEDGIEAEVKAGRIKKSRSWDKIAAWMGADATALRSTVDRYNTFCRNGYDADFLKNKDYLLPLQNPPYYAILAHQGIDTIIGITINHHMEVLDRQFRPIGGLYASGVATSGWLGEGYGFSGSELGFYIFSGYTLGRNSLQQTDW